MRNMVTSAKRIPKTFPVETGRASIPQIMHFEKYKKNKSVLSSLSSANLSVPQNHPLMKKIKLSNINEEGTLDRINGVEQNNDDRPRELILQSGHNLAEQFIVKYPGSFTMRFSDELSKDQLVQTSVFEELCNKQNCHEAWRLYQEHVLEGREVSTEDQYRLLDLFCYNGYKNETSLTTMQIDTFITGDTDPDKYRTHYHPHQGREYTVEKSIWLDCSPADTLLSSITEAGLHTEFTYCIAIQSMVKYHKECKAWALYKDMRSQGFKPNSTTYTALMCGVARDENESLEEGSRTIELMRDMVSQPVIRPHGDFFYHLLKAVETIHLVEEGIGLDLKPPTSVWEDKISDLRESCRVTQELLASDVQLEYVTMVYLVKLLSKKAWLVPLAFEMLDKFLGEQPERLLPTLVEQESHNFITVVSIFTNKMFKGGMTQHQLLLDYIRSSNKIIHTLPSHDQLEAVVVPFMLLPTSKMASPTAFEASKSLYVECSEKFDISYYARINKLPLLTKSAIVARQYDQLPALLEESIRMIELVKLEPSYDEGWGEFQLGKMTNIVFLGIRDAYLRKWNKYGPTRGEELRELAHRTFDIITSKDLVPNATSILVLVVINFKTGNAKAAIDLMESLYTKYDLAVPHSIILGSLRANYQDTTMDPVEWSELSVGSQTMIKNMILSFDSTDFNFLPNWSIIRSMVKNIYFDS